MHKVARWIGCISPLGKHPCWPRGTTALSSGAASTRVTSETGQRSGVQARPERVFWMRKWFEVQSKLTPILYEIQLLFYSSSLLSLLYTHSIFLSLSLFSLSLFLALMHLWMLVQWALVQGKVNHQITTVCYREVMLFVMIQITIWAQSVWL